MRIDMKTLIFLIVITNFVMTSSGLTADRTIQLATLNWEPYVGEQLDNYGFTSEIVAEGFKRAGYHVNFNFMPWVRVLKLVQHGKYDAMFPAYYSPERARIFASSSSFLEGPLGFCKRTDDDISYNSLLDLKPYKIGVVRGYVNTKKFDNADYLNKYISNSDQQNILMLAKNRYDLIVIDKLTLKQILKKEYPNLQNKLQFVNPPLEIKTLHVGFSRKMKDYQIVLKQFNQAIMKMTNDGTINKIMKKHGYDN